jgi:poly(A) polymerase
MSPEQLAREVARVLHAAGHQAFLVGGCVRDLLLGRVPKDFDVATDAPPAKLHELFPRSEQVGAHFGVCVVHGENAHVEVATFRSDFDYSDGRRPAHVKFESDPKQDSLRRDFTINALMLDVRTGEVLDFTGGRADLEAGIIRAIGDPDLRFREDHLRLLRAVRFAARFGFSIEPQTFDAIRRSYKLIRSVSAERVRDELVRILTEGGARRGLELMDETGLLNELLPEVAAMKGVEQPPEYHPEGDVWTHTLLLLEKLEQPTATLAMGALLHDVGKPSTFRIAERIRFDGHVEAGVALARGILRRLRFSNEQSERIEALITHHMRFKDAPYMRDSTLKRFLRLPQFDEHLELHRLDCLSSHGLLENYELVRSRQRQLGAAQLKPPPLITGSDLIAEGYEPGPLFGEILGAVEDAQLDGAIATREEALQLAHARYGRHASTR